MKWYGVVYVMCLLAGFFCRSCTFESMSSIKVNETETTSSAGLHRVCSPNGVGIHSCSGANALWLYSNIHTRIVITK